MSGELIKGSWSLRLNVQVQDMNQENFVESEIVHKIERIKNQHLITIKKWKMFNIIIFKGYSLDVNIY